jgi:AraC family transcriptional regulator, transcriptional activator of pobA
MEQLLSENFNKLETLKSGIPRVEHMASQVSLSPHYLSDLLKSLTGQSAQ